MADGRISELMRAALPAARPSGDAGGGRGLLGPDRWTVEPDQLDQLAQEILGARQRERDRELREVAMQRAELLAPSVEEDEIEKLIMEQDLKRASELRARMEKEALRRNLQNLERDRLTALEEDRLREVESFSREREELAAREAEVLREIEGLHAHLRRVEEENARAKEQQAEELRRAMVGRQDPDRLAKYQALARERGERIGAIRKEKEGLEAERQRLGRQLEAVAGPGAREAGRDARRVLEQVRERQERDEERLAALRAERDRTLGLIRSGADVDLGPPPGAGPRQASPPPAPLYGRRSRPSSAEPPPAFAPAEGGFGAAPQLWRAAPPPTPPEARRGRRRAWACPARAPWRGAAAGQSVAARVAAAGAGARRRALPYLTVVRPVPPLPAPPRAAAERPAAAGRADCAGAEREPPAPAPAPAPPPSFPGPGAFPPPFPAGMPPMPFANPFQMGVPPGFAPGFPYPGLPPGAIPGAPPGALLGANPYAAMQPVPVPGMYPDPYMGAMGAMGASPVVMQVQQQVAATQALLAQHEAESKRLQEELERAKERRERARADEQRKALETMLTKLHARIEGLDVAGGAGAAGGGGGGTLAGDLAGLGAPLITDEELALLPADSELRRMRQEHIAEMTRLRYEAERVAVGARVERMRAEAERGRQRLEEERWKEGQERAILEARYRKRLARELPADPGAALVRHSAYEPDDGFALFWDFAVGLPKRVARARLVFGLYENGQLSRGSLRAAPTAECEAESAGSNKCIFALSRSYEGVEPSSSLTLIVELQHVTQLGEAGQPPRVQSVGWAMLDLFGGNPPGGDPSAARGTTLNAGLLRLPLFRPAVRTDIALADLLELPRIPSAELYLRLCAAADADLYERFPVNDAARPRYKYPPSYAAKFGGPSAAPATELTASPVHPIRAPPRPDPPRRGRRAGEPPRRPRRPPLARLRPGRQRGVLAQHVESLGSDTGPLRLALSLVGPDGAPLLHVATGAPLAWSTGFGEMRSLGKVAWGQKGVLSGVPIEPGALALFELHETRPLPRVLSGGGLRPGGSGAPPMPGSGAGRGEETREEAVAWASAPAFHEDPVTGRLGPPRPPLFFLPVPRLTPAAAVAVGQQSLPLYRGPAPASHGALAGGASPPGNARGSGAGGGRLPPRTAEAAPSAPPGPASGPVPVALAGRRSTMNASAAAAGGAALSPLSPGAARGGPGAPFVEGRGGAPPAEPFQRGDGFDVYVDAARFLPDNVTVSKAVARLVTRDYSTVGEPHERLAELASGAGSPEYRLRGEYRALQFDATCTLLVELLAVNAHSRRVECVGTAALNVFVDARTGAQPQRPNVQELLLNEGAFQLPLRRGRPPARLGAFDAAFLEQFPPVPASTVLVRIHRAARSKDGLRVLSVREISPADWEALGLVRRTPAYAEGKYDTGRCGRPGPAELQIYAQRAARETVPVKMAVARAAERGQTPSFRSEEELVAWLGERLKAAPWPAEVPMLDYAYAVRYDSRLGFKVSVDGATNLPKSVPAKAIYSLAPPGSFYRQPPLTDDVEFTLSDDFQADMKHPRWLDGWHAYKDVEYRPHLCLIIDVRAIGEKSKGRTPVTPVGFAVLPVFVAVPGEPYVRTGSYQLPLFAGAIPEHLVEDLAYSSCTELLASALASRQIRHLEGASLFVRLADALRDAELGAPLAAPSAEFLPEKGRPAYRQEARSKRLETLVPKSSTPALFQKELNRAFIEATQINHYNI
eukprot:tig00020713_g13407.t1